jgi:hypothetical protein
VLGMSQNSRETWLSGLRGQNGNEKNT